MTVLLGRLEKKLDLLSGKEGDRPWQFWKYITLKSISAPPGCWRTSASALEQGQALAIIGSSGSGKTTLLRCLNFLEKPEQGTISVGGQSDF